MVLPSKLRWALLSPGVKVLVAVSGGPDSLSLLHILWTEQEARQLVSVEAAHLDHGLRGEEAAAEAAWVADWCAERGIVCHVGTADVAAQAREHRQSTQEAARTVRYVFLEQTAAAVRANKIATGHTRDDQVETVLGNILRGTGLDGLRGIPEKRGLIVRPLLDASRAEVEAYCAANHLLPRQDPSNLSSDHYTRNRIRRELLPQLRREYNSEVDKALRRLSEIAARDSDYLAMQAQESLAAAALVSEPATLVLSVPHLRGLHPALLCYVLRLALERVRGTAADVTYSHIERLCGIVGRVTAGRGGRVIDGLLPKPGCRIRVSAGVLTIEPTPSALQPSETAPAALAVPGTVILQSGWGVRAAWEDHPGAVRLDADAVRVDTLLVRTRQAGDRIDPLGMQGRHKKISDIFTDAKTPRSERDGIPLVADDRGLVWVAGHTVAERAKVTARTARLLFFSVDCAAQNQAGDRQSFGE